MNTPATTIAREMTIIAAIRVMLLEEEGLVVVTIGISIKEEGLGASIMVVLEEDWLGVSIVVLLEEEGLVGVSVMVVIKEEGLGASIMVVLEEDWLGVSIVVLLEEEGLVGVSVMVVLEEEGLGVSIMIISGEIGVSTTVALEEGFVEVSGAEVRLFVSGGTTVDEFCKSIHKLKITH